MSSQLNRNSFKNIAGGGNTLVVRGPTHLHSVIVNTASTGTIVVYDGTTTAGTKVATIVAPTVGSNLKYDVEVSGGLFVTCNDGTSDITLSYGM